MFLKKKSTTLERFLYQYEIIILRGRKNMKRMLPLLVVCILVLSGFVAIAVPIEKSSASQPELHITVKGGFGIHIIIENIGDAPATDADCWIVWNISDYRSWEGPFPSSDSFNLGTIAPGQSVKVCFRPVGLVFRLFSDRNNIEIMAGCAEHSYYEVNISAILLWRFIILT